MSKLLLDQNIPQRLVSVLADIFPESLHVRTVELHMASDREVFAYAAKNGYVLVTKDVDFRHWSFLFGFPPKVIWIRRGNCSTDEVAALLRTHLADIETFLIDEEAAILGLG